MKIKQIKLFAKSMIIMILQLLGRNLLTNFKRGLDVNGMRENSLKKNLVNSNLLIKSKKLRLDNKGNKFFKLSFRIWNFHSKNLNWSKMVLNWFKIFLILEELSLF